MFNISDLLNILHIYFDFFKQQIVMITSKLILTINKVTSIPVFFSNRKLYQSGGIFGPMLRPFFHDYFTLLVMDIQISWLCGKYINCGNQDNSFWSTFRIQVFVRYRYDVLSYDRGEQILWWNYFQIILF